MGGRVGEDRSPYHRPDVRHRTYPRFTESDGVQIITVPAALETEFSDDFNRSDTTYGFGEDWLFTSWPGASGILSGSIFGIGSNRFRVGHFFNAVNSSVFAAFIPTPTIPGIYYGVDQWVQATLKANSSASGSGLVYCGPSVLVTTESSAVRGYVFATTQGRGGTNNRSWSIFRMENGTRTSILDSSTASHQYALDDVFRLEVIIGGSSNDLTAKINGSTVGTVSDSVAVRPTTGSPGIGRSLVFTAGAGTFDVFWDDYSHGAL